MKATRVKSLVLETLIKLGSQGCDLAKLQRCLAAKECVVKFGTLRTTLWRLQEQGAIYLFEHRWYVNDKRST